jgi:FixJ family two-component response regulator
LRQRLCAYSLVHSVVQWLHTIFAKPSKPAAILKIVALIVDDRDRALLMEVAQRNRWQLHFAADCTEAWRVLHQSQAAIILCDRDLPADDWRHALRVLASSGHGACAILISRVVDGYLWNEVTASGGYDLIAKPLREQDLLRAVKLAWSYWNTSTRRHEIRPFRTA